MKQTSHWNGFTLECMCVCCLSPLDVANVFPHSEHACDLAPAWLVRMCLCRLLGSLNTFEHVSQVNFRLCASAKCLIRHGFQLYDCGHSSQPY